MAACVLLVLLIVGVGGVMAFVFGGATPVALVVGAGLAVMSGHGLRRIDPSQSDEPPPDDWGTAIGALSASTISCHRSRAVRTKAATRSGSPSRPRSGQGSTFKASSGSVVVVMAPRLSGRAGYSATSAKNFGLPAVSLSL